MTIPYGRVVSGAPGVEEPHQQREEGEPAQEYAGDQRLPSKPGQPFTRRH